MFFDEFAIKSEIPLLQDWPRPGAEFRDITPLFHNPRTARMVTDAFAQRYLDSDISHIAAVESQGFLLGSNLAYLINKPLILIRKSGKLPGPVEREDFNGEFGPGTLEIQQHTLSAQEHSHSTPSQDTPAKYPRVLLIDDLIATGATLLAASQLIRRQGGEIAEAAAIVDLPNKGGTLRLQEAGIAVFTLCAFD